MEKMISEMSYDCIENQVFMKIDNNNYTIPSCYFPLNDKGEIFIADNTYNLKNKRIENIFNKMQYKTGHCYHNADMLYMALVKSGISKNYIKKYVGWLVIYNNIPIHHSWLVYKNKYVLDLTPTFDMNSFALYKNKINMNRNDEEYVRKIFVDWINKVANKLPNTKKGIFGKVKNYHFYIGSVCEPMEGIKIYNQLIKEYPNHMICENVDEKGMTKTQQLLLMKNIEN